MKSTFFILSIVLLIFSSCTNSKLSEIEQPAPVNHALLFESDTTELELPSERSTSFYIDFIAYYNEYHAEHVGITGGKSEIYKAYEMLRDSMKLNELFPLLKHESEAVRIYAYFAIEYKDSSQVEKAWTMLRGKKDEVLTFSGCIGMTESVKDVVKGFELEELGPSK